MRLDAGFRARGGSLSESGGLDFDGDGKSDVFTRHIAFPNAQWVYSSGGTANYQNLAIASANTFLAFGRFDNDLKTDVFGAIPTSNTYDFDYSSGGAATFVTLSSMNFVPRLDQLRFGDFDGDARTDVFMAFDLGNGTSSWNFLPGGKTPAVNLGVRPFLIGDLQFGDLDGDGRTDPFATRALPDGRLEWVYWPGGLGDPIVLNTVDGPVPRLGDFVGDGRTDAMVVQCGAQPIVAPLPDFDVVKVPKSVFRHFVGDVNGDGIPDVIRSSVCQNYNTDSGSCCSTANLVQTLLGDGHGGFPATTPLQTLFSGTRFDSVIPFAADVTGDGLTDLTWLSNSSGMTNIYVAAAAGDGSLRGDPEADPDPAERGHAGDGRSQSRRARRPDLDERLPETAGLRLPRLRGGGRQQGHRGARRTGRDLHALAAPSRSATAGGRASARSRGRRERRRERRRHLQLHLSEE